MSSPLRTQKIDLDTLNPNANSSKCVSFIFSAHMREETGSVAPEPPSPVPLGDSSSTQKVDVSASKGHMLNTYAESHIGFTRQANEDSYSYFIDSESGRMLAAVADGIGGHENGDIASYLTMKMLITAWRDFHTTSLTTKLVEEFLKFQLEEINTALYKINAEYNAAYPMGTTAAVAVTLEKNIVVAHAGDSRIYMFRNGKLLRLTQDHSFVSDLIRNGTITEEEAHTHPYAHVISKSIGPLPSLDAEVNTFDWISGDRLLICTDGLMLHITDEEIEQALGSEPTPQAVIKKLMTTTLRRGGGDNVTMISSFNQ